MTAEIVALLLLACILVSIMYMVRTLIKLKRRTDSRQDTQEMLVAEQIAGATDTIRQTQLALLEELEMIRRGRA